MSLLLPKLLSLIALYAVVGGLSVTSENSNALGRYEIIKVMKRQTFLTSTEPATLTNRTISAARTQKLPRDAKRSDASVNKAHGPSLRSKAARVASRQLLNLRRFEAKTASPIKNPKRLSKQERVKKADENILKNAIGRVKLKGGSGTRIKATRTDSMKLQRKNEQRVKVKRKKKERISEESIYKNISGTSVKPRSSSTPVVPQTTNDSIEKMLRVEHAPARPPCRMTTLNESSSSLRSLFHVPRVRTVPDCANPKKHRTTGDGVERPEERGQSSAAAAIRSLDRGHMELVNEYENERSMDIVGVEYVHPEGHVLSRPLTLQRTDSRTKTRSINSVNDNYGNYFNVKNKREADDTSIEYRRALSKPQQSRVRVKPHVSKNENLPKIVNEESSEKITSEPKRPTPQLQNSSSQLLLGWRSMGEHSEITDTPWPLVPGPISCNLDFELQPSFVAKLGEFDYVVSVQRQQNPDVPAEHACTGVVYNPRFVVIAPHCLHDLCDNYGLTVTSTDDLCTIDETIEVDYIIEHENYDADTRKNDIALIKLKSEIHKKPAKFQKEDGALGKTFYAVGFGELMWKSFPTRISKLLQKMPVQRYQHVSAKGAAGTLDITTANLDLTGAFRGDFGGALISPRGEFVGLKSKLVKKSTEYEVYTRVRSYLPWIESMVALHGSW